MVKKANEKTLSLTQCLAKETDESPIERSKAALDKIYSEYEVLDKVEVKGEIYFRVSEAGLSKKK